MKLPIEFGASGVRLTPSPLGRSAHRCWVPCDVDEAESVGQIPLGRLGEPADVAGPVLSSASRYITGQVLHVNRGLTMR